MGVAAEAALLTYTDSGLICVRDGCRFGCGVGFAKLNRTEGVQVISFGIIYPKYMFGWIRSEVLS